MNEIVSNRVLSANWLIQHLYECLRNVLTFAGNVHGACIEADLLVESHIDIMSILDVELLDYGEIGLLNYQVQMIRAVREGVERVISTTLLAEASWIKTDVMKFEFIKQSDLWICSRKLMTRNPTRFGFMNFYRDAIIKIHRINWMHSHAMTRFIKDRFRLASFCELWKKEHPMERAEHMMDINTKRRPFELPFIEQKIQSDDSKYVSGEEPGDTAVNSEEEENSQDYKDGLNSIHNSQTGSSPRSVHDMDNYDYNYNLKQQYFEYKRKQEEDLERFRREILKPEDSFDVDNTVFIQGHQFQFETPAMRIFASITDEKEDKHVHRRTCADLVPEVYFGPIECAQIIELMVNAAWNVSKRFGCSVDDAKTMLYGFFTEPNVPVRVLDIETILAVSHAHGDVKAQFLDELRMIHAVVHLVPHYMIMPPEIMSLIPMEYRRELGLLDP
ncbi:TPA_asm: protein 5 [Apera virus 1]|uniref:Protein 5 n=1 Tax=Apera virus 1 TaxID=2977951 RepID=A0A9N6YIV6_9RHAB|nr:TPA_asm: protein 5 [Apera virus 1]